MTETAKMQGEDMPIALETVGLTKRFGSLVAVDDVSMRVPQGELRAVIGPNGAGKTTFFNLITGRFGPDEGHFFVNGNDVTGWSRNRLSDIGLGRAFQVVSVFIDLTVFENVLVPVITGRRRQFRLFSRAKVDQDNERQVWDILSSVGLADRADMMAANLAHGDKKRLDIAIALARHPTVLLLDEPTAGLHAEETHAIVELVEELRRERDLTVLLIEHNMSVVFGAADMITVLHQGAVISEGPPAQVRQDKAVIEAYLGEAV
jgi:branched-chain amino acid transport system ATP-binding protein